MPGIPLLTRQTSYSRSSDQMCRQDSRLHLSAEEEIVAEESFSVYCKPVELYNILQRRAQRNPAFLQRCLCYKVEANRNRRIQMTVSLSGSVSEADAQSLFPLHVLLARSVSDVRVPEYSAEYRFSRACIMTKYARDGRNIPTQASFSIPEISKLAMEARSGSVFILIVSCGTQDSSRIDSTKNQFSTSLSSANVDGYCLLGKISLESLYASWVKSPNLILGHRAEIKPTIVLHPFFYKLRGSNEDKYISFRTPYDSSAKAAQQVQVTISAEEFGAKEKSPYNFYKCSDIPSSSLSHIVRLRAGNVVFNYRYYNNQLRQTEVTEDFSCPFCLVKCASFKGLKYHLLSSHDLFNFEFWVTEEYQAVNVSVKTDVVRSEAVADGVDPKQQTFFFCPKPRKRKRSQSLLQNAKNVHPFGLEADMLTGASKLLPKADDAHSSKGERARIADGASSSLLQSSADPECAQSVPGSSLAHSTMLQFAKSRKLSIERSESRNRALLQKRQFFHSHRAQPMAVEQVMSDRDSEDEVDDDVADFEDRRMLDDFVDVTKDEKQMMHMWNSFVRKQRVLADSHIPWTCEAFSRLHGSDLIQTPALRWCWRLFMMKLWNHGLLDARTMNNCNIYLDQCEHQIQNQSVDPPIKS